MLEDLIKSNRSYRRFNQNKKVSLEILKYLINLARISASAANRQPLKYKLINDSEQNKLVFASLSWAGYLTDWSGPEPGERPSAYIVMLNDNEISHNSQCDAGIAAQSILLGAVEKGLGGCIFGSVKREQLKKALELGERYDILYVIAIGEPVETVILEEAAENEDIKYWRDDNGVHHVPKRPLTDLIL